MEAPARRLTLLPLVASTYFIVAGGPYGLEEIVLDAANDAGRRLQVLERRGAGVERRDVGALHGELVEALGEPPADGDGRRVLEEGVDAGQAEELGAEALDDGVRLERPLAPRRAGGTCRTKRSAVAAAPCAASAGRSRPGRKAAPVD